MKEMFELIAMRIALCGLAASLAVFALRSWPVRSAIARLALIWRGLTAFGRAAVCAFLLVGVLEADKTNNVPPNLNSPSPQMMQGSGLSLTGFTGLGEVGENSSSWRYEEKFHSPTPTENSNLERQLRTQTLDPVQTSSEDVARGYRQVCVTTNEDMSFAMPSDAAIVGNWHKRGTFGEWMRLDLGDLSFPLGTNDASYSSFSVFNDGRIRPTPRDVAHEICAVGVPMLAMQGESRFWTAEGEDGSKILTWENFFLNADTNAPVNAQIELSPDGDFATRSNEVETVYGRINPHDWDDDGLENEIDPNPLSYDGDLFGVANALPTNANPDAYYWIDLSTTGRLGVARISVVCDGPSNLGDHLIVARTNQVCHIPLLAGATYTVQSDLPIGYSAVSSEYAEIVTNSETHLTVSLPLEFSLGKIQTRGSGAVGNYGGSSLPINVFPSIVSCSGGCCSFQAEDGIIQWSCSDSCTCAGGEHYIEAMALWEGYSKAFAVYLECGCGHDDPDPTPQSGPYAPSVSVSFGKDAVIFEDAYENLPGEWVSRRSTATTLTIHANGGPNGGVLSVTATNLAKLQKNSGPAFPSQSVAVPADHSITYEMNYVGLSASETTNDVVVSATLAENGTANTFSDESYLTSVRLELAAVWDAPENPCTNRHVYGVGEKVRCVHRPEVFQAEWTCNIMAGYGNCFLDTGGLASQSDGEFILAYFAELSPTITLTCGNVSYQATLEIVEPEAIFVPEARLAYQPLALPGEAGGMEMDLWQYVRPNHVSFLGIDLSEVPCTNAVPPIGYFANPPNTAFQVHSVEAGAGRWNHVKLNNYWTTDSVHMAKKMPPWYNGSLTWKIPIGWRPAWNGSGTSWPVGVEPLEDFRCGRAIVADSEDLYCQVFGMESDGTASISKFGHVIVRGTNGVIRIDGLQIGQ